MWPARSARGRRSSVRPPCQVPAAPRRTSTRRTSPTTGDAVPPPTRRAARATVTRLGSDRGEMVVGMKPPASGRERTEAGGLSERIVPIARHPQTCPRLIDVGQHRHARRIRSSARHSPTTRHRRQIVRPVGRGKSPAQGISHPRRPAGRRAFRGRRVEVGRCVGSRGQNRRKLSGARTTASIGRHRGAVPAGRPGGRVAAHQG